MKFYLLSTEVEILDLIEHHNANSDFCVLDFETTSRDANVAKLIDIQMSGYEDGEVAMFDSRFLPLLKKLTCRQVWWNFKYDWKVAYRHGVDFRGQRAVDAMLLHHLLDENAPHDLDSIVQEKYGDDYKERFWAEYTSYQEAPFERRLDYGCRDIVYTGRVYGAIVDELISTGVSESLSDHVHRLAMVLLDTELEGVPVDLDYTIEIGTELQEGILRLEGELRASGGFHCEAVELDAWVKEIDKHYKPGPRAKKWRTIEKPEFNFASSDQVATLLYERLGLPVQISKKTKNRTVDDEALEELEPLHPMVAGIREYRTLDKMRGSFIDGILDRAQGAVIYPSFNVNGTKTGRISHSDPNMGQMPSSGEWCKIRGIFVPPPGHSIVGADYGQLEVAIAAHFSQDKNLLKIIHEGASKHDITAAGLGIERSLAKTLNFAMQYLCSPYKVKQLLGCSEKEALEVWKRYWATYEGEQRVINSCIARIEDGLPIINPFGRRRRFPGYKRPAWADPTVGKYDKPMRQAYNALTQGTGGDMMSCAFYRTVEIMKERRWGRGWFTVHDEGLIIAKDERALEARDLLVEQMLSIGKEIGLTVPLTVQASEPLKRWQK